jgi:hypothetical protein
MFFPWLPRPVRDDDVLGGSSATASCALTRQGGRSSSPLPALSSLITVTTPRFERPEPAFLLGSRSRLLLPCHKNQATSKRSQRALAWPQPLPWCRSGSLWIFPARFLLTVQCPTQFVTVHISQFTKAVHCQRRTIRDPTHPDAPTHRVIDHQHGENGLAASRLACVVVR